MGNSDMSAAALSRSRRDAYVQRYQSAEWRAQVFADMILDELTAIGPHSTVVDIGCGGGFDGSKELQECLASRASQYIGVEPDTEAIPGPHFTTVHRCLFEDAPIAPASVDVAFGVMVVEHVANPRAFMGKVAEILKDGGVFWAFTIDLRHWSAWCSLLMEKTKLKDVYLDTLYGKRGEMRYCNFPVQYRLNRPGQVTAYTRDFSSAEFISLTRIGAEDFNIPSFLRPVNHLVDHVLSAVGAPGSNLAFRLVRAPRHS
jgi:SAM-dependent methyltransferase